MRAKRAVVLGYEGAKMGGYVWQRKKDRGQRRVEVPKNFGGGMRGVLMGRCDRRDPPHLTVVP